MNSVVRNILAVVVGWGVGSFVNMALVKLGHTLFPIEGVDLNDMQTMASVMPTLDFKYFIFPFLAHALGTLLGATIAGLIATGHKMRFSLGIGALFLVGGIMVNYMIPGPRWFSISDILLAYIPMAWLGGKIAIRRSKSD